MMGQPILTIGIPTFNSCNYLKESIDLILNQIRSLDDLEILICDNSSDDGTQILIEEYILKFPDTIRYIRHQANLGMDRNFWSVIENAEGKFVHLLADDDFYTPNGVKRILERINSHDNLDAILLSNNYLNTCNGKIITNVESCTEDVLCESDGEKFWLNENLKSLCLSNIVVKRSKCLVISDIEKYFGSQWLHVALLTQIVKSASTSYIFNFKEPVVTVRIGNQKWLEKDGAIAFYYNVLLIFSGLKNAGYNDLVFEHIKKIFLPLVLNGGRIKFVRPYMNIFYCLQFFKFYYNMPGRYALFCLKLLLQKHRPFFEGWEKIGH